MELAHWRSYDVEQLYIAVPVIDCYTVESVEMAQTYLIPVKKIIYTLGRCPIGLKFYIKKIHS